MYGNNDYRDYLAHYGVLGMKWGRRKQRPSSGEKVYGEQSMSRMKKRRISKKYKKYQAKGDAQLKRNVNRLYVDAHNKSSDTINKIIDNGYYDKKYKTTQERNDAIMRDAETLIDKHYAKKYKRV